MRDAQNAPMTDLGIDGDGGIDGGGDGHRVALHRFWAYTGCCSEPFR
jgi:hypothetical protein